MSRWKAHPTYFLVPSNQVGALLGDKRDLGIADNLNNKFHVAHHASS